MSKSYKIIHNENQKSQSTISKEKNEHIDRQKELGLINPETGAFVVSKDNGELGVGVKPFNQEKRDFDKALEVVQEKTEITNRKALITDDLILNNQKFNMQLQQMSGIDVLFDDTNRTIGNFLMDGTVLVKVWEKHLKRYVLMRRPIRTPMFSNPLGEADVPEALDLDVAVIHSLGKDLAESIKLSRDKESLITNEMGYAQGGSLYDQGNNSSYDGTLETDSSESGIYENVSTAGEIINDNTYGNTYCWPVPGSTVIIKKFSTETESAHDGLDIGPPSPSQKGVKICSVKGGKVVQVEKNAQTGNLAYLGAHIIIDHGNLVRTIYGHLDPSSLKVSQGDEVAQGQYIANMGKTGDATTTMLHFSMYEYDSTGKMVAPINPDQYMNFSS